MKETKRSRPTYTNEFKEQAIAKCLKSGVTKTSQELGVSTASLRKWIKKEETGTSSTENSKKFEELEKENRRLRKELSYVNEINEILKKSTAIFSKKVMDDLK